MSVHHLTLSPRASPVQASVSLPFFASSESHAWFSFGVKLNLTIFLLESEIQSPLHFCHGKKGSKHLALTLASVYHPCTKTGEDDIYARFLDTLDTLFSKLPADNEIIMGADVNANIGKLDDLQSSKFRSTLGPHGFSKQNAKGEGLLTIYLTHRL